MITVTRGKECFDYASNTDDRAGAEISGGSPGKFLRVNPRGTLGTEKPGVNRADALDSEQNIEIDLKEF